jgi:phosphoribosylanthranilate isomerase
MPNPPNSEGARVSPAETIWDWGSRPLIKVCGVRTPELAVAVAHAGADFIGVNFAHVSKRRTDPATASRIVGALRALGPAEVSASVGCSASGRLVSRSTAPNRVSGTMLTAQQPQPDVRPAEASLVGRTCVAVGIFVEQSAEQVADIAATVGLDAVQLSGDCTPEACRVTHAATGLPVIPVVRLGASNDLAHAMALAKANGVAAILIDAPGTVGGSGHAWDHAQARPLVEALASVGMPVIVAGGLHSDNVRAALESSGGWGADVASGVETDGVTDASRVRAFVHAARRRSFADTSHRN